MLKSLSIQNIATAPQLFIEFGPGLNILTGSTGVGKSVVVNALALLTGKPFFRTPEATTSSVEAVFSPPFGNPQLSQTHITVRREFTDKTSRCFFNGKAISQKNMFALCQTLIDFTSQFEHQHLFKLSYQREAFDSYAQTAKRCAHYQTLWQGAHAHLKERVQLLEQWHLWETQRKQAEDTVAFIEEAQPDYQEFEKLSLQFKVAQRAQKFLSQLKIVDGHCKALEDTLNHLNKSFYNLSKTLPPDSLFLRGAEESLQNLFNNHSLFQNRLEDEQQQHQSPSDEFLQNQDRWDFYNHLLRRFGPTIQDVLTTLDTGKKALKESQKLLESIKTNKIKYKQILEELILTAQWLTSKRREHAETLKKNTEDHLYTLGMPHAQFDIKLGSQNNPHTLDTNLEHFLGPALLGSWAKLGPFGFETPQFWFSANPGMATAPLHQVISGGELSRIMLALKSQQFESKQPNVYVFDEIDTGLSGALASQVGKKLSEFCKSHQALCITHLPQVACHAHIHLVVTKETRQGTAQTQVHMAQGLAHIEAVAKLLSSHTISPESLAQAHVLVKEAQQHD